MFLSHRVAFTIFLYVLGLKTLFCMYFIWRVIELEGADFSMYIGVSLCAVFALSGLIMIGFQVRVFVQLKFGECVYVFQVGFVYITNRVCM